ncbi:MAG: efflux RND transporter permease subunit [Microthrixaceae bacterium]
MVVAIVPRPSGPRRFHLHRNPAEAAGTTASGGIRYMQRFWSWLAVNLGKRAGLVSVVGLLVTAGLGYGISNLDFATGQDSYLNEGEQIYDDSVAYQNLFGGQAMISVFAMDEGSHIEDLFADGGLETMESVNAEISNIDGVLGLIDPVGALQFSSDLVVAPKDGCEDPASVETDPENCGVVGRALTAVATAALLDATVMAEQQATEAGVECPDVTTVDVSDLSGIDEACHDKLLREAYVANTQGRLLAAGEPSLSNPAYVKFLLYEEEFPDGGGEVRKALLPFFPDDTHAMSIVRLEGNQSIEDEGATSVEITEAAEGYTFDNATVTTTGAPVLLKDINDYLRGGMVSLGAIALAVMALILIIFFNVRWRLLPLIVVTVGVIWAFGLTGYAGIPLTLVTIAGLPVMLGVGIDYAIQMHSRIEEEVIIDRSPHPIQEAARKLGGPMLVVTANAVLAFLAILASKTPMIRDFGLLLAVGIVAICISSIVNPLAILGIREYKRPTVGKSWTDGWLARFVNRLGSLPAGLAIVLTVLAAAVFTGGVLAEEHLEIQTDPIRWVNQDTDVIRDITTLEEEIGGSSEVGVYVVADKGESLYTDETVEYVDQLTIDTLEEYDEELIVGSSIVGTVSDLMDVPGATHVPPTGESVQAAWEIAPEGVQVVTASPDGNAMNIIMLTAEGSLEDRAPLVDDLRDNTTPPDGVRVTPSGLAVVGIGLLDNLTSGRILLTYMALALVFVWLTIAMRSLVRSLLAMVPVLIAVGTASLVAYFGGFKLSPMTAVGGPLVVAACTEFTTLILYRYLEERRRGLEPKDAIDAAGARTGRAFVVSALTTMAGVAVIALSSLPLLRDFGITVAINVSVALLSALVVLPPLVVWADKRGWVSKGMLDREDEPFLEVPRSEAEARALEAAMAVKPD